MNTPLTRTAQVEAWLDANPDALKGLPAEVTGVKVVGKLDHPVMGDGWGSFTYQVGGISYDKAGKGHFKKERNIKRFKNAEAYKKTLAARKARRDAQAAAGTKAPAHDGGAVITLQRTRIFDTVPFKGVTAAPEFTFESAIIRRNALSEIKANGTLRNTTRTVDTDAPDLWDGLLVGKETQRRNRNVQIREDEAVAAPSLVNLEELQELLRSVLSVKEFEALDQRAHGEAQTDRSGQNLRRAREKAGKIIIRGGWKAGTWTTV